jgi:hypothetical protein
MPGDSIVWIYQSSREFTPDEEMKISSLIKNFTESWTAHDVGLRASFEIRYHLFIILMIDGKHASASGCSIDKSIHLIRKIENDFSVSLLDRQLFALKKGNNIQVLHRNKFDEMKESGMITSDTIVFNNLVQTREELKTKWELPFRESWHATLK